MQEQLQCEKPKVFSRLLSEKDQILIDLEEKEKSELENLAKKYSTVAANSVAKKDTRTNEELEKKIRIVKRELIEVIALKNNPNNSKKSSRLF